ncbi:hypothetical protein R3P38DRAFT_2811028 [Favolaschia claudopus]|uniref:Uncharacterized protein n=1 Tax=Favolaschia claudopus TaxID=2862362 RepID=A0AAV9ZAH2_9AGAR
MTACPTCDHRILNRGKSDVEVQRVVLAWSSILFVCEVVFTWSFPPYKFNFLVATKASVNHANKQFLEIGRSIRPLVAEQVEICCQFERPVAVPVNIKQNQIMPGRSLANTHELGRDVTPRLNAKESEVSVSVSTISSHKFINSPTSQPGRTEIKSFGNTAETVAETYCFGATKTPPKTKSFGKRLGPTQFVAKI